MDGTWSHPYRERQGEWIRGNFHGHCVESSGCARVPLMDGAGRYAALGARFMAVTDHDVVTDLQRLKEVHPGMIFLEGFEYSRAENVLFIGETVPPLHRSPLPEALQQAGNLLTILCHPQPNPAKPYWTLEKLRALGRFPDGIEIFNGHYGLPRMLVSGYTPLYTRFWDELLTLGIRAWGFANDDFHEPEDFNNGFNMVQVEERTAQAVLQAAKGGRFYASTGLLLEEFREHAGRVTVTVNAPCTGRFVGPEGRILAEQQGQHFHYTTTDEAYVRFEAAGAAGMIFLQPMTRAATVGDA